MAAHTAFDRKWMMIGLKKHYDDAVCLKKFEKAARLRDKMKELKKNINDFDGSIITEFNNQLPDRYGIRYTDPLILLEEIIINELSNVLV